MMCPKMSQRRGNVLLLILVITTVSIAITLAYSSMVRHDVIFIQSQYERLQAFYIAEAGLNKAVWYLMNTAPDSSTDASWRTNGYPALPGISPQDPREEEFASGRFTIWVEDVGANIRISSQGIYKGASRLLSQEFTVDQSSPVELLAVTGTWRLN